MDDALDYFCFLGVVEIFVGVLLVGQEDGSVFLLVVACRKSFKFLMDDRSCWDSVLSGGRSFLFVGEVDLLELFEGVGIGRFAVGDYFPVLDDLRGRGESLAPRCFKFWCDSLFALKEALGVQSIEFFDCFLGRVGF